MVRTVLYYFVVVFAFLVIGPYCLGKKENTLGVETDPVVFPTN